MDDLIEIGWVGKAHGLRGEIKLHVSEFYEEDLLGAESVHIGSPPVPYFVERIRAGGAIILKLEDLEKREQVSLLSNRPLFLMVTQVAQPEPDGADTPFDALIGWSITAEDYPTLGPISGIMDLPEHYLAELTHGGKDILVPLHEHLVLAVDEEKRMVTMQLPGGLLDM